MKTRQAKEIDRHRMIYVVNDDLFLKIREMKDKYHFNISSLIRGFLENQYRNLSENKKD